MTKIEDDIDLLFDNVLVQKSNYEYDKKNITLKEITFTNYNVTN